eukprot:scaffold25620_cov72-Phaeocystis_antarctica.AAC.2
MEDESATTTLATSQMTSSDRQMVPRRTPRRASRPAVSVPIQLSTAQLSCSSAKPTGKTPNVVDQPSYTSGRRCCGFLFRRFLSRLYSCLQCIWRVRRRRHVGCLGCQAKRARLVKRGDEQAADRARANPREHHWAERRLGPMVGVGYERKVGQLQQRRRQTSELPNKVEHRVRASARAGGDRVGEDCIREHLLHHRVHGVQGERPIPHLEWHRIACDHEDRDECVHHDTTDARPQQQGIARAGVDHHCRNDSCCQLRNARQAFGDSDYAGVR